MAVRKRATPEPRKSRAQRDGEIVAKAGPWRSSGGNVYPCRLRDVEVETYCAALARIANRLRRKGTK